MTLERLTQITSVGITSGITLNNATLTGVTTITSLDSVSVGGNITAVGATFSGNVSIAGTLTYEDVTNIDSVGLITARSGIHVTGAGSSVGIGTDNPAAKLEVATSVDGEATLATFKNTSGGGINQTVDIKLGLESLTSSNVILRAGKQSNHNSGAATDNFFAIHTTLDNTSAERLRISSSGNIGIGSESPTELLDVAGNTTIASNGRVNIYRPTATATNTALQINSDVGGTDTTQVMIQSGGNVGISTNNPQEKLHVQGDVRLVDNSPRIGFHDANAGAGNATGGIEIFNSSGTRECYLGAIEAGGNNLTFGTNDNERVRIDENGTTNIHRADGTQQLRLGTLNGSTFSSSRENYLIVYGESSSDYVLIRACNTADGTPILDCDIDGTRRIEIEADGDIYNVNGTYGQISDARLKENIVDAGSQWDDIKALRVRNFNFREDLGYDPKTQIGFVAQEVEEVSPGLVKTNPDEDLEGNDLGTETKVLRMSVLHIKAVKALQEAMERIETLEAEVATLKGA
jgi:hypothetical protein